MFNYSVPSSFTERCRYMGGWGVLINVMSIVVDTRSNLVSLRFAAQTDIICLKGKQPRHESPATDPPPPCQRKLYMYSNLEMTALTLHAPPPPPPPIEMITLTLPPRTKKLDMSLILMNNACMREGACVSHFSREIHAESKFFEYHLQNVKCC